jgi:hypothetical protein
MLIVSIGWISLAAIRFFTGNTESAFSAIAVLLCLTVFVFPVMAFARKLFSSRAGRKWTGKERYIPIFTSRKVSFFIRRRERPWWVVLGVYILFGILLMLVFLLPELVETLQNLR